MNVTLYEWKRHRLGEVVVDELPPMFRLFEHEGRVFRVEAYELGESDGRGVAIELREDPPRPELPSAVTLADQSELERAKADQRVLDAMEGISEARLRTLAECYTDAVGTAALAELARRGLAEGETTAHGTVAQLDRARAF